MNPYKTLNEAFKARATDDLSITFIEGLHNETRFTYRELYQRALQLLHYFQSKGLQAGDELIFFLKNNEKFIEAYWACIMGGIIPVPVAVGISDEHRSKVFRIFRLLKRPHLLTDNKSSDLLHAYAGDSGLQTEHESILTRTLLLEGIRLTGEAGREHIPRDKDLAFIQFSSGSTRDPKGVCLTHENLMTTMVDMGNRAQYTARDISLSWMPLTHDLGLIGFHLNMIVFGISQHIMTTEVFSRRPLLWLQKAHEKRATLLSSPNFGYKHYLKMYETRADHELDLSCVRIIMNGAEPISVALCQEFLDVMARHGLKRDTIYTCYGLAEAALGVSMPMPGSEFEYLEVDRNRLSPGERIERVDAANPSVVRFVMEGPPLERCGVRIGDAEAKDLGVETIGEIQIRGPNVTSGYYNDAVSNRELYTADGWLKTGDLGFLYREQVVVTGRLKDIIFANGQNFYPHDLEAIVLACEGLELGKVATLGVRRNDEDHDDILVCIVFRGELSDFLPLARQVRLVINEQTGLDVAHVLPVQRIPKTTSGKVQRRFFADSYLRGEFDDVIGDMLQLAATSTVVEARVEISEYAHRIKFICDRLLPEKKLGLQENFFEVGMSSLELAQIHEQIDALYPGVLDITDMFDHPTMETLAEFLRQKIESP
jgi:acyl-CoA synthetase (AMP-forming)/AMP-acid ligase II